MSVKKSSLSTLSNEALCKLRDEIAELLNTRANQLRKELDQLIGSPGIDIGRTSHSRNGAKAGNKKLEAKYQGPDGNTWCGRGKRPRWLNSAMKEGKKLEDFLITSVAMESQPNSGVG
jgi:DNA-binding protein H-NS